MSIHYNAFISYKHHPIDIKVAQDVQKQIEHYRIPKYIQKKTGIKKFRHVFRDITELSGSADLPADIEEAIKQSDYLIVVCSKRTSESPWVTREIEMFLTCHDRKHILTVLVDGEPREVIPDILLKEQINIVGSDGTIFTEERDLEPLSCDYRKGFRIARNQEIPRLAARFLNCDYNELFSLDRIPSVLRKSDTFIVPAWHPAAVEKIVKQREFLMLGLAEKLRKVFSQSDALKNEDLTDFIKELHSLTKYPRVLDVMVSGNGKLLECSQSYGNISVYSNRDSNDEQIVRMRDVVKKEMI